MPKLANERNELYARHRAKGMLPAKAAIASGYATGSSIYSKLDEDPEILARISELMSEMEEKREQQRLAARESAKTVGQMVGVGKAWVIAQLAENAQLARMEGEFDASNTSLKLIGEHFGMWGGGGKDPNDNNDNVPSHIDMDTITALTQPKNPEISSKSPEELNEDLTQRAMKLIGSNKVNPKDRMLTTGSETDVVLKQEVEAENETDQNT